MAEEVNEKTGEVVNTVEARGTVADFKIKGHKLLFDGVQLDAAAFKMLDECANIKDPDGNLDRVIITIKRETKNVV